MGGVVGAAVSFGENFHSKVSADFVWGVCSVHLFTFNS